MSNVVPFSPRRGLQLGTVHVEPDATDDGSWCVVYTPPRGGLTVYEGNYFAFGQAEAAAQRVAKMRGAIYLDGSDTGGAA